MFLCTEVYIRSDREKFEVSIVFQNPVETAILKVWHGNPIMNLTLNNNPWYLCEPNEQYMWPKQY